MPPPGSCQDRFAELLASTEFSLVRLEPGLQALSGSPQARSEVDVI